MMTIKRLTIFAVCLLLVLAGAATNVEAQDEAQVRFVHTFVDAPDVDIFVNGTPIAEGVPFGAASDYLDVPAGDIEVSVTAAGEADELFGQTITTGADPITLVVSNANGFIPYVDNVDPLDFGETRITAIHAIDGGPVVDVVLADGRPVVPELEFGVPFGTLDLPVIKLPMNVVPSGSEIADAIFEEPFVFAPATGTSYMVVVYGTLDAPEVMLLATAVNPGPEDGFLQITHDVAAAPAVDVFEGENLIVAGLSAGETTVAFPVPAGDYDLQITETETTTVLTEASVSITQSATAAAVVEADGDAIVVSVESAEAELVAMEEPDVETRETEQEEQEVEAIATEEAEDVEVVEAEPQPTEAPVVAEEVAPPTPAEVVAAQPTTGVPTARVIIDPGANIQLRQYPDENALSLGLAPSGAVLDVNGREGAPVQIEGLFSQEIQREIDNYTDPAENIEANQDIDQNNTWLNVTYTTPDGGTINAWTRAEFLAVSAADGTDQRLADLPTIPNNAFGEALNTEVTSPQPADDVVVAIVFNLNPGVNLKIRRTPSTAGETLSLIQAGTVLELIGFEIDGSELPGVGAAENAEWAYIRYVTPEGAEVTGWVSTQYIQYQWRGEPIDFDEMEARTLLLFEDPSTRGELGAGAAPPIRETEDPLRNQVVATVEIDAGANLQLRRDPDSGAESLGLVPSGTQLIVTARDNSGDWLFVEFEGATGWIAGGFVDLTFNGDPFDVEELIIDEGA